MEKCGEFGKMIPVNLLQMEDKVLEFLSTKRGEWVETLKIAKYVCGPEATKKDINPCLYSLEKGGLIQKTCQDNGAKPRWTMV